MPAGAAENRQATTQTASTVSTKALTVQVPSGASITINGRDVGLNPADGYDPNPSDNDISTMKVIGTGAGTTELKNLPAGWYVSTQTWNWQGQNGIRYHVWSGSTNYNWFLSGATNFKHCVYELRSLDYFRFGDESNLLTGYDWSQNQTLHGYIENAQPGYHIVAGWSGGGQPLSDRYRYQWTADDDPSLTITHDFMYDSGEAPADWSKLMAWLPDGSPVTGFNPNGSSNKIPTGTKSVTWTGIPDGWNVSDTRVRTDRIVTDFSKTGQADRTVILFYSDDYEPTYTADQLKKLTATTDTGDPITGFDPVDGGTFALPATATGVTLDGTPDGWNLEGPDYDGTSITYQVSSPDSKIIRRYTFALPDHTPTLDDLADLTPTTDGGKTIDGFDPTKSGTYQIPEDATVSWTGIPRNGWTWSHVKGTPAWTIASVDGQYSFTYTFLPTHDPVADDLVGVTATTDTGETVEGFDPVNGGTFPVPAGTKQVSLSNIPDGWTATPLDEGIGYTLTASNGLTVTYTFDVQPYTQMTADELAALAKYQWKSDDSTVQATANDTDTLEGHPTDWTLVWSGTGTNPLIEDPDAGWYDSKGNKVEASSLDAYEYRMKVAGPTSGVSATFTLHTSLRNEPIIHNVSFDMKGGSPQERTKRVIDGKTVAQPADPTREGYRFAGWLLNGKPYDFSTPVTSNIVLTASWTAIDEHAIIFDSAGGSFVPAQTVEDGETGTQPEPPTREGYTFKGWLLDGQSYDFSTPVTGDITLTADWVKTPVNHTVTFDTDGGAELPSQTVADGETATQPEVPVRDGYVFLGWLLNGKAYDFSTPVTGDITLTASWEKEKPATHTIRFDTADGTTIPAQTVTDGSMATKPADPTRKGYTFNGWTVNGQPYDFSTPVTADLTIIAKWVPLPVEHTVLFDAGDGSKPTPTTVEDGKPVDKPKDPTRKGYTFDGWLLNGKAYDFTQPVTGDITLTGSWTRLTHTVTFNTNGGTPVASQSVEDGGTITSPKDPTREGYEFKGWLLDGKSYNFKTPVTSDITLTADWAKAKPASHTVTFDAANGSTPDTVKVEDGKTVSKPKDPTREGYTFQGWTSGGKTYDFNAPVTTDITLTASWEKNKPVTHTVTIDPANGAETEKLQVENGQTVKKPADPVRKGYTFQGWYQGDKSYDFSTPVTGDITITAHWIEDKPTPVMHTVTFNPDNGEKTITVKVEDGKTITKPSDPVLEGFTFMGWYKGNNPYEFGMPVTGDFTLTAHWQQSTPPMTIRTVTIDPANGEKATVLKVEDGQKLTKPTEPKKDGYTFLTWYLNDKPYDFNQPVTRDITIVAQWEKNKPKTHTVTYDYAYDGLTGTSVVTDGKLLPKPTDPKRAGYVFKGWRLDGKTYDFNQPVTKDLTLTADWELAASDKHTVTFDTKGGSAVSPVTVKDGNTIAKPEVPARKGYEFKGWLLNGQPYDFTTPVTSDITLTADWAKSGTTKPTYGIDDLKDLGFMVDGKPYKPFNPNTNEYRLTDGEHTVQISKGTLPADWQIMSNAVLQPDGTNKIGYRLISPDGSFTTGYTFIWNEKTPEYTVKDLKHVTATAGGKKVNNFDPTRDGSYTVPDGSTVRIEGLPSGWLVTEDHDPAQPSMWIRYTVTSPDSKVKVSYTFNSDRKSEGTKPETGKPDQSTSDKGVDGMITGTVDSQLSLTGVGVTRLLLLAMPLLLAGIAVAVWPAFRRKRSR